MCSLRILGRRINRHQNLLLLKHESLHVPEELLQLRELHGGVGVHDPVLDPVRHHDLLLPQLDEGLGQEDHLQDPCVHNLPSLHKAKVNLNFLIRRFRYRHSAWCIGLCYG